jgi:hypothetical protein
MTTSRSRTTLQDELLADLRVAAPIPVPPPTTDAPATVAADTPTVSVRVTPWRWARPSLDHLPGERPTLRVGPLHLSVSGFDHRHR